MGYRDNGFNLAKAKYLINRSRSNKFVDTAVDQVSSYVGFKAKDILGKEYYLDRATQKDFHNEELFKWLEEHDKNYSMHYSADNNTLNKFMAILYLGHSTFAYVATRSLVPGKAYAAIMDERIEADLYVFIFGAFYKHYCKKFEEILDGRNRKVKGNRIYSIYEISTNTNNISSMDLKKRER